MSGPQPLTQPIPSACDQLVSLGWEINAHQYRLVHLAARYDEELDWFHRGLKSAAAGICSQLQIQPPTAREWIRVGHSLRSLPLIDAAFAANEISYAKARILTRWAEAENEQELLELAHSHAANRLTTAIAKTLSKDETDEERDQRHHQDRSVTSYTDGDGMVIIRAALPPSIAKPILAAINELVRCIAQTPADPGLPEGPSRSAANQRSVADPTAGCEKTYPRIRPTLSETLRDLRQRWQPGADDDWVFPSLPQQRADAFAALFLGLNIDLTTEVVIHMRGDGNTFDDGTPITTNAIAQQLDRSFVRMMIHDAQRTPLDASNRRRHPTTRQKRVVLEAHNHECVDCGTTDLLELDHNPPFEQTGHSITTQLEPRCAPCHRARHRVAA